MGGCASSDAGQGRVPRIAPGCDPTALALSPAEGYLLSRVDGATSWSLLRQIGGLPPRDVDRCLQRWLEEGVLVVGASAAGDRPPEAGANGAAGPGPADASAARGGAPAPEPAVEPPAIDPGLAIAVADQKRVIAFQSRLTGSYYEILDLPRDADGKAVKRAYFKLSKEYHPDRYFRREIGPYHGVLERIFRKLVEAYELLSDPATRAEIDRALDESADAAPAEAEAPAVDAPARRRPRKPRAFGVLSRVIAERKRKAKRFYETGIAAFKGERWLEAAASVRLAIAFDPHNDAYKEGFVDVVCRANEVRSAQILREADAALDLRRPDEALNLYEEALHLRPHDPEVNYTAARIAFALGKDLRKAKEYGARACEVEPENAAYHRLLGRIYSAAGLSANARRELEAALRLDPKDAEARSELRNLRRG